MSRVTTGRTYGLVYLVYNTIGNLLTQDDQVPCFENAARHLTDDGVFVLECRVPTEGQHRGAPAEPVGERRDRKRREGREPDGGEPGAEHGPRSPACSVRVSPSRSSPKCSATSASAAAGLNWATAAAMTSATPSTGGSSQWCSRRPGPDALAPLRWSMPP
jgi:hypothetical protein